jgi:Zn-dependent protease
LAEPALAHAASDSSACSRCGTELAPALLACPSCQALVHSERLRALVASAEERETARDVAGAAARWREALELLPRNTRQYDTVLERLTALGEDGDKAERRAEVERVRARYGKHGAIVSAIAVFVLKFKFVIVLLLTKGKLLLLGLTKLSTLSSMALFFGFDARFMGCPLALGLVLSIYVHEMGHVAANRRHGIRTTAPMFIPGFGALIVAQQRFHSDWVEADVGLAGPLWGLGAAIVEYAIYRVTGNPFWATLTQWCALINLFNLTPVWQLDGAHAFKAMSRAHRLAATAALLAAVALTGERMLWLPFLGASWAVFTMRPTSRADLRAVGYYVALTGALSLLTALCRLPI